MVWVVLATITMPLWIIPVSLYFFIHGSWELYKYEQENETNDHRTD